MGGREEVGHVAVEVDVIPADYMAKTEEVNDK